MSDLEQRITDVLVRVEGVKLTSTQFNKDMPVGTPMQALKDATTELKALYEQYAAEQVGEALGKLEVWFRFHYRVDLKQANDSYYDIKDKLDEIAAQYGVNREETE